MREGTQASGIELTPIIIIIDRKLTYQNTSLLVQHNTEEYTVHFFLYTSFYNQIRIIATKR